MEQKRAAGAVWTKGKLLASLKEAGVDPNKDLLVHSAMSKIGYVEGGPATVVEALRDALHSSSTLINAHFTSSHFASKTRVSLI